jgi:hypothetical protein
LLLNVKLPEGEELHPSLFATDYLCFLAEASARAQEE